MWMWIYDKIMFETIAQQACMMIAKLAQAE